MICAALREPHGQDKPVHPFPWFITGYCKNAPGIWPGAEKQPMIYLCGCSIRFAAL